MLNVLKKNKKEQEKSDKNNDKAKDKEKDSKTKQKKKGGKKPSFVKGIKKKVPGANENKEKSKFRGERGFTYPFGYSETDAYIFVGQKTVISVFDILLQYGKNNHAPVGWLLNLIPREEVESGRIKFIKREKGMDKATEGDVVDKHIEANITTIGSTDTRSAKENSQNVSKAQDMMLARQLAKSDVVIDSDIRMIIKAKTADQVEKVVEELKDVYKNYDTKGIIMVRRTGKQLEEMRHLFSKLSTDAWHNSDMVTVAAGQVMLPSSGFSDEKGTFVGTDVSAYLSNNPSIIDFAKVKNAVIFTGGTPAFLSIGGLEGGSMMMNGGSAIGHVISESSYLSGKRIHHIMLSEFDYRAPDSLEFDMSKEAINPFEVFGTPETVQNDATANFNKATTVMMLLLPVTNEERYANMETDLKTLMIDYFINRANGHGMYTNDPEHEPNHARQILATPDHENYPTPYDMLGELQGYVNEQEGEVARKEASFLYKSLQTAFDEFPNIFHKHTTLPDVFKAEDRNIYYDLSLIQDKRVRGAVFLNVLAYVTNRALNNEIIVIHGIDYVNIPERDIVPYKERMARKNIGLITIFEHSEDEQANLQTYRRFTGRLSQQDAVVLGNITETELRAINQSWRQELPYPVASFLMNNQRGVFYFYRERDKVGALINTHLIL